MTARTLVAMHGVRIEASLPPWERAWSALLSHFPDANDDANTPTLSLCAEATDSRTALDHAGAPVFFFGVVQGYLRSDGYTLSDVHSRVDVDRTNNSVFARILLRDGATAVTTGGMQHAALCLALREHGLYELHAAGLCTDDRALLVVGNSGSGKTSTALALVAAGCGYLGDDRVLLREEKHGISLRAYPREFHVPVGATAALPSALSHAGPIEGIGGKRALDARRAFPNAFVAQSNAPVALLFPRISGEERTEIAAISQADALGLLLESSALALVEGVARRDENLRALSRLASRSAALRVSLGRDALADPVRVARSVLSALDR